MIEDLGLHFADHLDIAPQRVLYEKCIHVLRGSPLELSALRWVAKTRGYHWFHADMATVDSRTKFFDVFERSLSLPVAWGRNWDALEDCLKDLSWLSGRWYMCLLEHCDKFALAAPYEFRTTVEILARASDYWWERRVPLHLFLTAEDYLSSYDYGDIADRICLHRGVATQ